MGDEICNFVAFDPSISDALTWAYQIHQFMTVANATAWNWWAITLHYGCDNSVLLSANTCSGGADQQPKRLWAIGNWSKYVRPGWIRIGATANPTGGVYVSAFKQISSGNFAIVVINQNANPVSLGFSLSGFPSVSSVTPALTSATANLVDQANQSVSNSAFSYSLPATSIVTFHGTAGSSSGLPRCSHEFGSDDSLSIRPSLPRVQVPLRGEPRTVLEIETEFWVHYN